MSQSPKKPTLVVSGVVIERDGLYLLVQDKVPWVYGKWNLPAGKVDKGETLEQAAAREAKEECGFTVEITGHLLTLHKSATEIERPDKYDHAELHAYGAKIIGGALRFPQKEILNAKWFSYEQVKALQANGDLRTSAYVLGAIDQSRLQ